MTKSPKTKSEIRQEFISKLIDNQIKTVTSKICNVPYETFLGTPEKINLNIQKLIPADIVSANSIEIVKDFNEDGFMLFSLVINRPETSNEHSVRISNETANAVKKLEQEMKIIVSKFNSGKKLSAKEKELLSIAL